MRFRLTVIFGTRKFYFKAIRSHKVQIEISCEILLNVSLSSLKARFKLWYVVTENVILKGFPVIRISCEILINVSLSSRNARFRLTIMFGTQKCYFLTIRSHKVEIHIWYEILLNISLSSWNARFGLTMISGTRKFYF